MIITDESKFFILKDIKVESSFWDIGFDIYKDFAGI